MHYGNVEKLAPFVERVREKEALVLLTLGDSNTCNTHWTKGAKQWPELLHSALKDHHQTQALLLVNAGINGDTVESALDRFDTDVRPFSPDLAIVCLGSNDAHGLTDDAFRDGLRRILDHLDLMGAAVLLLTPPPIMEVNPPPKHIYPDDTLLRSKIAVIRQVADEREAPFVDTYAIWRHAEAACGLAMELVMADETHMNGVGHKRFADELAPVFGLPAPAWVGEWRQGELSGAARPQPNGSEVADAALETHRR